MAHFRKYNMTLCQIWYLVTSGDLNIDLSEKWLKYFQKYSLRAIECFFPPFLSILVFELGGVVILTPSHHGEGGWDRHQGAG